MKLPDWQIEDCKCVEVKLKDHKKLGDVVMFKITFSGDVHPKQITESARTKGLKLNVSMWGRSRLEIRMLRSSDVKYKDELAEMWVGVTLDDLTQIYAVGPQEVYKARLEIEFDCRRNAQGSLWETFADTLPEPVKKKEEEYSNSFARVSTAVTWHEDPAEILEHDRMSDDGAPYFTERTVFNSSDVGLYRLERCEREFLMARWAGGPDTPGMPTAASEATEQGETQESTAA